jgi:glycosyltransferase involved in cell wall biosynthesis
MLGHGHPARVQVRIMRVLLLTQVLPYPPDSGPKVKTWNVLKFLSQHHEVTLASFVRGDQSDSVRHLEGYCTAVQTVPMERGAWRDGRFLLRSLATGQPFLMVRDDRSAMRRLVERLAHDGHFDVVHADQLNMAQYAARVPGAFRVLDAHNALWLLYKRLWQQMDRGPRRFLLGRDWRLLKEYEGRVCRDFDAVLAVSEVDKAALEEAAGQHVNVTVIPIAIDTDEVSVIDREPDANHILHIGTMYWPPNIDAVSWFARYVFPLIRQQAPDAEFDVIGARPPQAIIALGGPGTGINVLGYVEDPTPYIRKAALMVVPVRAGGGMRVKILNAMAQGVPVVSTSIGYEGIDATPGQHLLSADDESSLADAAVRLLLDRSLATRLAEEGRHLIEQKYDYRAACLPIQDVYNEGLHAA